MRSFILAVLVFASAAHATSAGGITGRSGKQGITCSGCHSTSGAAPTVTLTGPTTLVASTLGTYKIELSGGPAVFGGFNIAADSGTLRNKDGTVRLAGNELTHGDKRAFAAGKVSWDFYFTAPATPGTAKLFIAGNSTDGSASTSGDHEIVTTFDITVSPANQAPTVATAATAPATLNGTTVDLSVLGADDNGEAALKYTWSAVGPTGSTTAFSVNGTNAAKATVATVNRIGSYTFTARIADAANLVVDSAATTSVTAKYTTLVVTPAARTLSLGSQLQLSAAARDQFAQPMTAPGTITWAAGQGTITSAGLYTTPAAAGGPHTVTATCLGIAGTAAITVVVGNPPTVAAAAAATRVGNTGFVLTVLGSDDGGEALLRYTWAVTAGPPGATFAPNGTNLAKRSTVTLTRAGEYTLEVTVTDRAGLSVTSKVTAKVDAELTAVKVTPQASTLKPLQTLALMATAQDQFDRAMTAPGVVTWTSYGGGTVSSGGDYHAGTTLGGPFQVRATLAGKSAVADVTIANDGVPLVIDAATASPSVVSGRTARLRLGAADEGGEAGLVYHWESTGPSPVTFAPNDTNAAKQAVATFAQAGTYSLTATITNAAAKSTTAQVEVSVQPSPDRVEVTPAAVTLRANAVQPFTAALLDQFGDPLTGTGAVQWATVSAGTLDASGVLRAVGTAGHYVVSATASGLRGQAQVTIDATSPTVALTSPKSLATLEGTVTLTADATDDEVLNQVRFYADGVLLGAANTPPWQVDWQTTSATDGSHELRVEAEDAAGNVTKSGGLQVQVWNDKSRPRPGPAMVEGPGCTAAGGELVPLVALLSLLVRKRKTVSRARQLSRDTSPAAAPKRPNALGPVFGTRAATGTSMLRSLFVVVLLAGFGAHAQLSAEQRERCATRLSVNLLGTAPSLTLMTAPDPRTEVPNLLADPLFVNRFAAFITSRFGPEPTPYATQDSQYYLTQRVLTDQKPWKDLFVGPYVFTRQATDVNGVLAPIITEDPNGFGYTGSTDWRARYQGNELQGFRLVHAYRLINNFLGVELKAALNTNGVSAEGRKAATCAGCHYQPIVGLDLIARVLPRRGQVVPADVPQVLLGGRVITTERELLSALVESPDFKFNACRTAMRYAYGRAEHQCEGPVFDACMSAFGSSGTMQAALTAIVRHPTYCQ